MLRWRFMTRDFTTSLRSELAGKSCSTSKAPKTARQNCESLPFSIAWFSLLALVISCLAGLRIAEADIWFHLRNVEQSLSLHSFLKSDWYTFTSYGSPLVDHEWLSEVPYYMAFRFWDLQGLLAVYLVLLWLVFGCAYYRALGRGSSCGDAALVTIVGVVMGSYSFGPRMHHFGWLCLMAVLLVLDRFERDGKGLWLAPIIFATWVNLHGSWVFGFVVLGIYIVSGLVDGNWKNIVARRWTPLQLRMLLLSALASFAAIFVNPYAYKLVWYPFELLFRQRNVQEIAPEWQSVDFHTLWGKLAILMILGLLAAAWFSTKPWPLSDILLASFALWMALSHARFLLFAAIILIPIIAPHVQLIPLTDERRIPRLASVFATFILIAMIFWSYPTNEQLHKTVDSQFPRDAVAFIKQKGLHGRLFSAGPFSGYVELYAPMMKTFADGRLDIFIYNGAINDYFKINKVETPLELLDKHGVDYVLYPIGKPLGYVLDRSSNWRVIYQDSLVKLYSRNRVDQGSHNY